MARDSAAAMEDLVKAVGAASERELARLRGLSLHERGVLLASACEAASAIERSRLAAGLPPSEPAPWPPSTWEFLKKHAARFRS
jgi:hypothetical protein